MPRTRKVIQQRLVEWDKLSRREKLKFAVANQGRLFAAIDAGCRRFGLNSENQNDRRLLLAILADVYIGGKAKRGAGLK